MKKIKILALLVIVAFVVQDLMDGFRGFTDGYQAAGDSTEHKMHFDLAVRPTDTFVPDTLRSIATGTETPYWATRIEAYGDFEPSVAMKVCVVAAAILALFVLYGIYCMIRLVIAVLQGCVFTHKNVRRMRIFVYSALSLGVLFEVVSYVSYLNVVANVVIPGYEVVYGGLKYTWLPYFLLALFTEIFAVGVKLKEEQDLTI